MKTTKLRNRFQREMNTEAGEQAEINARVFGQKLGLITRLIGCSHREVSRPFVEGNTAYRSCLKCGARRQFDPDTFETFGSFYSPPVNQL